MPYKDQHSATLMDPKGFEDFRVAMDELGEGIHAVFGIVGEDSSELQAIRFNAETFTADEARAWLEENGHKVLEFEEATGETDSDSKPGDNVDDAEVVMEACRVGLNISTEDGDTFWHKVLASGAKIEHPIKDLPGTREFLEGLARSFSRYTRDGEYMPPALVNHDWDGDRQGDILDLQFLEEVAAPMGAGLYARIRWTKEGLDKIRTGKQRYLSPTVGFSIKDWNGDVHESLLMEISMATIPHVTSLPALEEGVASLSFQRSRLRPRKHGGSTMATQSTAPLPATGEPNQKEEIAALRRKLEAVEGSYSELKKDHDRIVLEEATKRVNEDIKAGFWAIKDDTEGSNRKKLVSMAVSRPEDYDFFRGCSPRVERSDSSRGTSSTDVNARGEEGSSTSMNIVDFRQARKDRQLELKREGKTGDQAFEQACRELPRTLIKL